MAADLSQGCVGGWVKRILLLSGYGYMAGRVLCGDKRGYYAGYYSEPYVRVVRYRRVIRPAYAYYGGPRFYGPRYGGYYRRW